MRKAGNYLRGESAQRHLDRAHGEYAAECLRQYLVMQATCPLVMEDLAALTLPLESTVVSGDPYGTHVLEGGRLVMMHVQDMLGLASERFGGENEETNHGR